MANKGWDADIDDRLSLGDGPHGTCHRRDLKDKNAVAHITHMTSLKEQYENGGEWNTELPGPDRVVPRSPYRTGVVVDGNPSKYNVAAYDGIYGP